MATLAEKVSVGIIVAFGLAYAVVPAQVARLLAPGTALLADGVVWANTNLPRPVFLSIVFLGTTIVAILVAISFARVLYVVLKHAGPRTKRLYGLIAPSSPVGKLVMVLSIVVAFLLLSVWAIPYFFG